MVSTYCCEAAASTKPPSAPPSPPPPSPSPPPQVGRLGSQHKLHTPLGCSTRGTTPCDARSRLSLSSAELWTVSYWTVLALVCLLVYVRLLLSTDERSHMGYCEAAESGFGWSSHDTSPWRGDGGALYAVLILHRCTPPGPSATCLSAMDGGVSSRGLTCSSVSAVARYGKLGAGVLYTPSGHEACAWAAAQSQQGDDA